MVDVAEVVAGVAGGLIVGVAILLLDWLRRRGERGEDRAQGVTEALASTRTTVGELKTSMKALRDEVRQIRSSMTDLKSTTQEEIHKLDTGRTLIETRSDELDRRLSKVEAASEALQEKVDDVGELAGTARELAHRHPIIGGERV